MKQHLAAVRQTFDWLVPGPVPLNPAASHVVRQDKTPVLESGRGRAMLDSIDATTPAGLRDRALIGLTIYARIGAAPEMKVEDGFTQNRRFSVPLRERGGKARAMPCSSQPGDIPHRLPGADRGSGRTTTGRCSAPSGAAPAG